MARDGEERPRLAPLEPHRVALPDGSAGIALRDLAGVLSGSAVIDLDTWRILARFDGRHTLAQVERALSGSAGGGRPVARARIEVVARQAAQAGLLEGPARASLHSKALARYRQATARAPACAGSVYPSDPRRLSELLDGYLDHPEGPGRARAGATSPVRLLVAPHIDFGRGAPSYAHAYRALQQADGAQLYVVFGTAHASPAHTFTLTRHDYDTPLGRVPTDQEVAGALIDQLGEEELLSDELVHRDEHSCEFQMVWLRHLFPGRPLRALPVLCSSISHLADPSVAADRFLAALERAVAGRKVCYLAGADLAHVGPRYGDRAAPTAAELAGFARADRRTLRFLEAGDAARFHADAVRDDARRRLCGVAPIYAAMRASKSGARLLHYGQWTDGIDSVSFAAAAG